MFALLLLLQATTLTPTTEAEQLGLRLAQSGPLSAILPSITAKETEEMLADHPDWTAAEREAFRDVADTVAETEASKLFRAMGASYARRLSIEDLRALVAFNESDAAGRWHDAEPLAMVDAAQVLGSIDYKHSVATAFCAKTGKGCEGADTAAPPEAEVPAEPKPDEPKLQLDLDQ